MPRAFRLYTFLLLVMVGLTAVQPGAVARASMLPQVAAPESVQQGVFEARPGPIVRQAFDLLMDRFVLPKNSGAILNGGLDSAHHYLESKQIEDPLEQRPAFTGDRREDWRLFLPAYERVAKALGTKGSQQDLDRSIVDGMAKSLKEAHTYYMPPEVFREALADLQNRNQFAGIGVAISLEMRITDVYEESPASQAGLLPGDVILAVDGATTDGNTLSEVSGRIRGDAGTTVTLTIRRPGEAEPIVKSIVRAIITNQWMRSRILDGNIGYLQIRTFALPDSLPTFNRAMNQFADENIRALIIDLRGNPGGSVATGVEIASRLMPDQMPIYQQVDRRGPRTVTTWGDYWNRNIPIAVLTNAGSGSMSEILAAALQENGLARIIGTKTAGAVAAGVPIPLADGSGLLVTIEVINTPSGRVINEVGLEPDQVVELDPEQYRAGKDTQLEAALGYVREQIALRGASPQATAPSPGR